MKAWRRDAAKAKQFAIESGKHVKGARYGRAIRNARRRHEVAGGLQTPLIAALFRRFYEVHFPTEYGAFMEALEQLAAEKREEA